MAAVSSILKAAPDFHSLPGLDKSQQSGVQSLARAPPISQCHAQRFQMSLNSPSLGVVKWPTGSCWGRRFFFLILI